MLAAEKRGVAAWNAALCCRALSASDATDLYRALGGDDISGRYRQANFPLATVPEWEHSGTAFASGMMTRGLARIADPCCTL